MGTAVFVPPPVIRKTTDQRTARVWPAGTLIFDTVTLTAWAGDGATVGGQPVVGDGPPGPPGPKGDPGDPGGPPGPQGEPGAAGPKGDKGDKGDTGDTGPKGDTGDPGATGAAGAAGATGAKGDKGDKGDTGDTGAKGDPGDPGATGPTGPTGPTGVVYATAPLTYDAGTQTVAISVFGPSGSGHAPGAVPDPPGTAGFTKFLREDGAWTEPAGGGGGGGGAVTTVCGRTGDVVVGESDISGLTADLAAKAPLASPTFTGTVTVPAVSVADGSDVALGTTTGTKIGTATTQKLAFFNATPVAQPTGSALTALGDLGLVAGPTIAESDVTNLTTDLAALAPLASPALTGAPTAPTAAGGTNTTQIATTAFVLANLPAVPVASVFGRTGAVVKASGDYAVADVTGAAPLASPTFTGTVTLPAVTVGDGSNIALGATTGTKIGTSTGQKLGFFNYTPVVQPAGNALSALQSLGLVAVPTLAESDVTNLTTDLAAKASSASPTFTGTVTLPAVTVGDGSNVALGTTTGTKIGTATTQKLAFYNSTPIVKPSGAALTALSNLGLITSPTLAESDVTNLTTDLAALAPLASPTFTGTVTLPAVTMGDAKDVALGSTTGTKIGTATTQKLAFYNSTPIVKPSGAALTALSNLGLIASPTLAESDVTNLTTDLAAKAPLATPTFTGTVTLPAVTVGDGSNVALGSTTGTKIGTATTQKLGFYNSTPVVQPTGNIITALGNLGLCASGSLTESNVTNLTTDLAAKAPLASPTFTGTPAAPTAAAGTNTTQLATTAFVANYGFWGEAALGTPPQGADFSWVNQGTATVTDFSWGLSLSDLTPSGSNDNLRMLVKTPPATPWTCVFRVRPNYHAMIANGHGIVLRESSTGKLVTIGISAANSGTIGRWVAVAHWASATAAPTYVWGPTGDFNCLDWFKITNDGTNIGFYASKNGLSWSSGLVESKTAYLAGGPNQIGIYVDSYNSYSTVVLDLLSMVFS